MEPQTFIESGIVENYVLGIANVEEMALVEEMCKKSPEVFKFLEQNQTAIGNYAYAYEIQSPLATKNKIFNHINMDKETQEIEFKPVSPIKTWWVAASLVISAASLLGNVYYGTQTEKLKSQLAQINKTNNRLTYENLINKANYRSAAEQLSLLHKHGNKTTHLEGTKVSLESSAVIYWNSETKDLYISLDYLPKEPEGKQYQLWAVVKGKPVSAGLIDIGIQSNYLLKMKDVQEADAFAISLEKAGGAISPDANAIYLTGSI